MALGTIGFAPVIVDLANFATLDLRQLETLIVPLPTGAALSPAATKQIIVQVRRGLKVYLEGDSLLARGIGVQFQPRQTTLDGIKDRHHPAVKISWAEAVTMQEFSATGLTVFCTSRNHGPPVLAGGSLGAGRWLYSGVALDASQGWGYGRFPYFHEAFLDWFHLQPVLERSNLIAYLDWGYYYRQNPRQVAARLKADGIREVHLSSWYKLDDCRTFFSAFITACHSYGILVYSWLELPEVTNDFWNLHPQWREQTARLTDAQIDWRYLMALEIPECMTAVQQELQTLLTAFPWDGVDVAELYFDTPVGFDHPESFTPLSQWVRNDFAAQAGVDPVEFFAPPSNHYYRNDPTGFRQFLNYRSRLLLNLNQQVLQFVGGLKIGTFKTAPPVTLTLVDTVIDTQMGDYIGINGPAFLALQNQLGCDLQVEDPGTLWNAGPDRYRIIGNAYRPQLAPGTRLTVDINIVDRVPPVFPAAKQTGLEFLSLLYQAGLSADQVCIYAANTPAPFDFKYARAALAGSAVVTQVAPDSYQCTTPHSVVFKTPIASKLLVNGRAWPCVGADGIRLPVGMSVLTVPTNSVINPPLHITDLSTDILEASATANGVRLRYSDHRNVLVTIDHQPRTIATNGIACQLPVFKRGQSYTVCCPAGTNEVFFGTQPD